MTDQSIFTLRFEGKPLDTSDLLCRTIIADGGGEITASMTNLTFDQPIRDIEFIVIGEKAATLVAALKAARFEPIERRVDADLEGDDV